jgi:hypothetical protein
MVEIQRCASRRQRFDQDWADRALHTKGILHKNSDILDRLGVYTTSSTCYDS